MEAEGILNACTIKVVANSASDHRDEQRLQILGQRGVFAAMPLRLRRLFGDGSGAMVILRTFALSLSSLLVQGVRARVRRSLFRFLFRAALAAGHALAADPDLDLKPFLVVRALSPARRYSAGGCPRPCRNSCRADLRSESAMRSPRSSSANSKSTRRRTCLADTSNPPSR